MTEIFDHDEYHIYTTTSGLNFRHVHLTEDTLNEVDKLQDVPRNTPVDARWIWEMRLEVAEGIYLSENPGTNRYPKLESPGYEGWETVDHGKFEDEVWFDGMIFHKCTGKRGMDPKYEYEEVLEDLVLDEHRDQFLSEFEDYIEMVEQKERNHPVVPQL